MTDHSASPKRMGDSSSRAPCAQRRGKSPAARGYVVPAAPQVAAPIRASWIDVVATGLTEARVVLRDAQGRDIADIYLPGSSLAELARRLAFAATPPRGGPRPN